MDFVYFNNKFLSGVTHSGDNRTGAGDGDDESVIFDFAKIDQKIESMVVVVSCFNGTFTDCQDAFVRVEDGLSGEELGRWTLSNLHASETSLITCKLVRNPTGTPRDWIVQIIGEQIQGRSIIDFFHQDREGPMAALRQEFKRKANCMYDDNLFFQECKDRETRGYAQASSDKS